MPPMPPMPIAAMAPACRRREREGEKEAGKAPARVGRVRPFRPAPWRPIGAGVFVIKMSPRSATAPRAQIAGFLLCLVVDSGTIYTDMV